MNKARKKWWQKGIKAALEKLRHRIAEASYSCLTVEEIEELIQVYAELNYLLLNGDFIKDE